MSLKSNLLSQLALGPQTPKQLRAATGADGKKVKKALAELAAEKQVKLKKGQYQLAGKKAEIVDAVLVKLARGFGFAQGADGEGDIFIPGSGLLGAMPGDEIDVALSQNPRREGTREGAVCRVKTPMDRVVGMVEKQDGRLVLVPDNARETPLVIRKSADGGAKAGEKAAGIILERGTGHDGHRVGITMRFGSAESARQCIKAVLYGAGVEKNFPPEVKAEAKKVGVLKVTKEDVKARKDLREYVIFTIDSADTKDIDDAISAKRGKNGGYELGVHIADVSHYVTPKSALDGEAFKRGTSVYFGDSVIPMLPRQLSNGICSLNEGEDRLAFSCRMKLDEIGDVTEFRFCKSVIKSRLKGVYSEVNALLAEQADNNTIIKYGAVADTLLVMHEIYEKLAILRKRRGCFEIESDEPKIELDAEGVCVGIQGRERGVAERMIEEFMLLANGCAAKMAKSAEIPFVYRVHEKPAADRVENLKVMLTALGVAFSFQSDIPTQNELSDILDKTRGTNLEVPVHNGVLRTMAKAKYSPRPDGHYGLALADYAHFTSPIRRYPDLAIHRILSQVVCGEKAEDLCKKYGDFAWAASDASSKSEVRAQNVERICDDCYKAEYMRGYIGEEFDGIIVSALGFGVFVALDNTVEGLVHASHLSGEHMELVEGVSLKDPQSGRVYKVGDAMRVRVAAVDVAHGMVDFVPAVAGTM